jgi:hypothetical protein
MSKGSTMTIQERIALIRREAEGTIFGVTFIKRTNGDRRHMICRLGVSKGVTGTGSAYDPAEHGLLPVYDMYKHDWRSIPVDAIERIRVRGRVFRFASATADPVAE